MTFLVNRGLIYLIKSSNSYCFSPIRTRTSLANSGQQRLISGTSSNECHYLSLSNNNNRDNCNSTAGIAYSFNSTFNTIRRYSRYSASSQMSATEVFKISDYNVVGFDLDNTLLHYNIGNMVQLEYDCLAKHLVSEFGYSAVDLIRPIADDLDFLQKGLVLDFDRGNVLKLAYDGTIMKASHGTQFLSDKQIQHIYGEDKQWNVTTSFVDDMMSCWDGPHAQKMRTLLDYFDMPASLIFARIIDSIDRCGERPPSTYNVWPDILSALIQIYTRENFANCSSEYFAALKANPDFYIRKTNEKVINWLKEIKKTKATFLVTGSHIDFATLTATHALGENWRELFDVVVCFSKKPGFFTMARPFVELHGIEEGCPLKAADLKLGGTYSQGNWFDLMNLLGKKNKSGEPLRPLYVGDNLLQDVYAPTEFADCASIAVAEEMIAEGLKQHICNLDYKILVSNAWGSYFNHDADRTLWSNVIQKYSKICVPSVEVLANYPIDYAFKSFTENSYSRGYYPEEPLACI